MFKWWRERSERRIKEQTLARWRAVPAVARRIEEVLALEPDEVSQSVTVSDPRSLPSNPEFVSSGWTDHMLLRYLLAFDLVSGKRVLDSCCGLGWGSYLVSSQAERVVGIDLDAESIAFCRQRWGHAATEFVAGTVLELPFDDASFDVVLCMEAIEHFTLEDGRRYLAELRRVCKPGGHIVGSSAFPERRDQAERLAAKNEHHLYVYTRPEMRAALREHFGTVRLLTRHYFAADADPK